MRSGVASLYGTRPAHLRIERHAARYKTVYDDRILRFAQVQEIADCLEAVAPRWYLPIPQRLRPPPTDSLDSRPLPSEPGAPRGVRIERPCG